ncbi:MAG TPA: hypothetical protein VE177_01080, partial [Candidatus Binatus sp.]|nr:hypothetical protein [Candidatus Binatus sp.]
MGKSIPSGRPIRPEDASSSLSGSQYPFTQRLVTAIPLPIFIGLVAVFDALLPGPAQLSRSLVYEQAYLNTILQLTFLTLTSYIVFYVSV